jgi:hypothetical protein
MFLQIQEGLKRNTLVKEFKVLWILGGIRKGQKQKNKVFLLSCSLFTHELRPLEVIHPEINGAV